MLSLKGQPGLTSTSDSAGKRNSEVDSVSYHPQGLETDMFQKEKSSRFDRSKQVITADLCKKLLK